MIQKVLGTNTIMKIGIDLTYKCNFQCSYCCAKKEMDDTANINNDFSIANIIFLKKKLVKIIEINPDITIKLEILGGEPTLNKNINFLFKTIIPVLNNSSYIEVSTNGSKLINIDTKWITHSKIQFLISYHAEFMSTSYFINIFKKYPSLIPNIMLPANNTLPKILNLINKLKNNGIKYDLNIIHDTDFYKNDNIYKNEVHQIWEEHCEKLDKIKMIDDSKNILYFSAEEIFNKNMNRYYGWKCLSMAYRFEDNEIINECTNLPLNLHNIGKPIICPKQSCTCDMYFNFKKEINEMDTDVKE